MEIIKSWLWKLVKTGKTDEKSANEQNQYKSIINIVEIFKNH